MKQLLFFMFFCISFFNCTSYKKEIDFVNSISVATVVDVTDQKIQWPSSRNILGLFDCYRNREAECWFSLTVISEKITNPTFSAYLPDVQTTEADNISDDVQFRAKKIIQFQMQVKKLIDTFYKQFDTTKTQKYSECWSTICTVLEGLVAQKSSKKVCLIYSDLLENGLFNAYKLTQNSSIETIGVSLNQIRPVPKNLSGITIIVVYNPMTREEDIRFYRMYEAYKLLLEKKGAVVKLQVNRDLFK